MPTLIELTERYSMPHCTREHAAQLLESLRTAYRSLPAAERSVVNGAISQAARVQLARELNQENECFELAS